ncbi:MAG: alpha/beta hydrolase [Pyrinomonadaceae bacterium]
MSLSLRGKTIFFLGCLAAVSLCSLQSLAAQNLTFADIKKLPVPPGAHLVSYGNDPSQFGELRLPQRKGPYPVVVVIHGGCWYSEYSLSHIANFNASLTRLGVATWSLEYRRIGNPGAGFPGTFADVASGTDYLRVLARSYPLDLKRVIVIGHSAGGQLALWLAARPRLAKDSLLYSNYPLRLRGIVSLAGITDLRRYRPNCGEAVNKLLGGPPEEFPYRYEQTSPIELLPLKVEQHLIHGALDNIVLADFSRDYETAARKQGDRVRLTIVANAGHFDLIAPQSSAWPAVEKAVRSLLMVKTRHQRTSP